MHLFISWHSVFRRHHKGKPFKVFRASPSHNAINRALSRHGNGKAMVRVTANELKPPFKVWNVTEILASRGGAMQTRGESVMMGGWKEKKSIFSSCFFYSTMWRRATSAASLHVLQGISKKFCLVCISPPVGHHRMVSRQAAVPFPFLVCPAFIYSGLGRIVMLLWKVSDEYKRMRLSRLVSHSMCLIWWPRK